MQKGNGGAVNITDKMRKMFFGWDWVQAYYDELKRSYVVTLSIDDRRIEQLTLGGYQEELHQKPIKLTPRSRQMVGKHRMGKWKRPKPYRLLEPGMVTRRQRYEWPDAGKPFRLR